MRMRRALGQHMLVDRRIIERIVSYAELREDNIVLEIGCGTGNLTAELLKHCRVVGIEKDRKMVEKLKERFSNEIEEGRLIVIHGDALKSEFPTFTKIVSNIPYKISSPLTFKFFRHKFESAVVTYQKEFAERLCREDNRLGVVASIYCSPQILETVKPSAFRPKPKVESAVVKIIPKPRINVKNRELFEKFVTFAFTMRRKRMGKIVDEFNNMFSLSIEIDGEIAKMRPEELGAEKFKEIVDDIRAC